MNHPHRKASADDVDRRRAARIGDAEELQLASRRRTTGHCARSPRCGSSAPTATCTSGRPAGRERPWYRHALASRSGRIQAGGHRGGRQLRRCRHLTRRRPSTPPTTPSTTATAPAIVGHVTGPDAHAVTIRLLPDDEEGSVAMSRSYRRHRCRLDRSGDRAAGQRRQARPAG